MENLDCCRFCLKNFTDIESSVKFELTDQIRSEFKNVTDTEVFTRFLICY